MAKRTRLTPKVREEIENMILGGRMALDAIAVFMDLHADTICRVEQKLQDEGRSPSHSGSTDANRFARTAKMKAALADPRYEALSDCQIAREFGCHYNTVVRHRGRIGLPDVDIDDPASIALAIERARSLKEAKERPRREWLDCSPATLCRTYLDEFSAIRKRYKKLRSSGGFRPD